MKSKSTDYPEIGELYYVSRTALMYDINGDTLRPPYEDYVVLMVGHQAVCDVTCIKLWWLMRNKHIYTLADRKKLWYPYETEVENGNE